MSNDNARSVMTPQEIAALSGASLVEESTRAAYVAFPDNDKAVNVGLRVCIDNLLSMTNESPVSSVPMVKQIGHQMGISVRSHTTKPDRYLAEYRQGRSMTIMGHTHPATALLHCFILAVQTNAYSLPDITADTESDS